MRLASWRAIASPSPVPPWRRVAEFVGLGEPLEDVLLRAQRNADAGVLHVDAQHHLVRLDRLGEHLDGDAAALRELDRVGDQVDQDLLQRARRAVQRYGTLGSTMQPQLEPFVARLVIQERAHRREQRMEIEGAG